MYRVLVFLTLTCGTAFAAAAPSVDTLKEVLTRRFQSLRSTGMTERNVLFQEVRAGTPTGVSYPFQVTVLLRDYGPGYPANRFYGETCVSRFDKARFALTPDEFGGWLVEGALTPPMANTQCQKNPSAGVSSVPVATLQGSPAPAGNATQQRSATQSSTPGSSTPVPSAPSKAGGALANGSYECWAYNRPRLLLNFSIRSSTQYTGSDGTSSTYSYDAGTGRVTFHGGALDGVMPKGFYAVYHAPTGHPTVSFRNSEGSEVSFCEKAR